MRHWLLVALVGGLAVGGCGDGEQRPAPVDMGDAATDAADDVEAETDASETGADATADADSDADSDAEAGHDASDAEADAGDAAADAGSDAGDAATDAGGDATSDAGDAATNQCTTCHGSGADPAPPLDLGGNTSTTSPGVGAHQAHLATSSMYRQVECSDCHLVPSNVQDPGHMDGLPADLTWGSVASAEGVTPSYANGSCWVYCHGATLGGGVIAEPEWTGSSQAYCGSCHGLPPPAPHPAVGNDCGTCHPFDGLMPLDPSTHVDGTLDVVSCGGCHAIPPTSGAHAAHYGNTAQPPLAGYGDLRAAADYGTAPSDGYVYGCGNCHPLDGAKHGDGTTQVELYDPAATAGSLKSKNPSTASYTSGTCSDVYCHSSGQETPSYVVTPDWNGGQLPEPRCSACHDNPPSYPSGGPGTATANSHLFLANDGFESGHFGGLPGPWHTSYHGATNDSAAPITCQTCHYDTVDPANVGPGGFYYLDTSGNYQLPTGSLGFACGNCHTGAPGAPAVGSGAVLAALHVDGTRNVSFDPRQSIPAGVSGLPPAPDRPTFPYWVTAIPTPLPPSSTSDGLTWSLHLANADYDPVTKTCSNVPCHLKQSFGTGRSTYDPLRWGSPKDCNACHQY